MSNALVSLKNEVFAARGAFTAQLSDTSLKFDQEAGFAIQTLENNSFLASTAMKNPQSLRNAVTNTAAIGISLNPAKKQAYLVPRDGRVCLDISYMGLMDLAMATGAILWGQAFVVREKDQFALTGLDQKPHHVFNPFSKERGEVVGVYVVVKTHHGDYLTHAMAVDAVIAIRNRSSAWKSGKTCPWHTDFDEMAKKTCVKQAYKYWPKNARLETAIHHMNTDGGEGLDFTPKPGSAAEFAAEGRQGDAEAPNRDALVADLKAIAKTGNMDALVARFGEIGKDARKAVGGAEWEAIKLLCEHGEVIEGQAQEISE